MILFRRTEAGYVAYGHAAAMNFDTACRKAAVEMERHPEWREILRVPDDRLLTDFAEEVRRSVPAERLLVSVSVV